MKDRKLLKLLSSMDHSESRYFVRWLEAEWPSQQEYVRGLARHLVEGLPGIPEKEAVWEHLYPAAPFDDARLRKLIGDTNRKLEEFLAIQAFRNQPDLPSQFLLRELLRLDLPDLFLKTYRKASRQLERTPLRNAAYFKAKNLYGSLYHRYWTMYHSREKNLHFLEVSTAFDQWWMIEKMEGACINLSLRRNYGVETEEFFVEEILDQVKSPEGKEGNSTLWLYVELYRLLRGDSDSNAGKIQETIQVRAEEFAHSELEVIFTLLRNHYIGLLKRSQNRDTALHLLELYQWGLKEGWMLQDGHLGWDQYKNILTICLWLENYELAHVYLEELKPLIPEEVREEAYRFNLANLYFSTGKYEEVLQTLRGERFSQLFVELPTRVMLIQAEYELYQEAEEEWLITQLESLQKFLRKKSLSEANQQSYQNFLRLMKKLLLTRQGEPVEKLLEEIEDTPLLYQKKWLARKAQERLTGP